MLLKKVRKMNKDFDLNIVSCHDKFKNKVMKKHYVDGLDTVGAWGDEPFEVLFINNTGLTTQVKLSIDGTDILTGKLADTEVSDNMWLVKPYESLRLKAFPETNNGGARFMFTSEDKGVASNTHGNLSSNGIIAAAVYVEGYSPPKTQFRLDDYAKGGVLRSNFSGQRTNSTKSFDSYNKSFNENCDFERRRDVEILDINEGAASLPSVGAGEYVNQKLITVAGLNKPVLSKILTVKYLWWDDLVEKLNSHKGHNKSLGFPGDKEKHFIDLKDTPRLSSASSFTHDRFIK